MKNVLSFIAGLLSGGLVGAAVVLLIAPQSGEETRRRVAAQTREILAAAREAIAERRKELQAEYQMAIQIPLPPARPEEQG